MRHLALDDELPLTCTRSGTCCHGKDIRITPWELARLAEGRGMPAADFRKACTVDGGARLACNGAAGWRDLPACSQYDPAQGCRVHPHRPLACRLYPLGRERSGETVRWIHEGSRFPCLDGCPEVERLPRLTVRDYLDGQGVEPGAQIRDAYLEIAQDLAEAAFVLVFDSGLDRVDRRWRDDWRGCVSAKPGVWAERMLPGWHDRLTAPALPVPCIDGMAWAKAHGSFLQTEAQSTFATLADAAGLRAASRTCLAGALILLHGVGADAPEVGRRWLERAR